MKASTVVILSGRACTWYWAWVAPAIHLLFTVRLRPSSDTEVISYISTPTPIHWPFIDAANCPATPTTWSLPATTSTLPLARAVVISPVAAVQATRGL